MNGLDIDNVHLHILPIKDRGLTRFVENGHLLEHLLCASFTNGDVTVTLFSLSCDCATLHRACVCMSRGQWGIGVVKNQEKGLNIFEENMRVFLLNSVRHMSGPP